MKKLHTNIANNLRDIRQNEKKWHQNAMAEFLGVSTKYYNQMENGKANLTLDKIEDIAKKLEKNSQILRAHLIQSIFSIIFLIIK